MTPPHKIGGPEQIDAIIALERVGLNPNAIALDGITPDGYLTPGLGMNERQPWPAGTDLKPILAYAALAGDYIPEEDRDGRD